MREPRSHANFVGDIYEAALKAQSFVVGMNLSGFQTDDKTVFAVVRALEIVGEATKRVPQGIRNRYPDVPWRSMAGIRDKLIHDYLNINLEIVWKAVTEDLPILVPQLQRILTELENEGGTVAS